MSIFSLRRRQLSRSLFQWARKALPAMSSTEREAIEAGDVWWDADLFTGTPDWNRLLAVPPAVLTADERAFLQGPVVTLCDMLDDWKITWELRDLPPAVWAFLKTHKFFGMIIPREYGGLGFSAYAHSEVVRTISTRSVTAAVTVMVPNSLGPGELLMQFGTEEQRARWLPRLADGSEIPCFGLTSPEAGSDAAAMVDTGRVCLDPAGSGTVGIVLNWHKRYITLSPVATVLGLAFKLSDPDRLLGGEVERGISVALVPTDTPGVEVGRRHLPSLQMFQNGPTRGHDVFVPLDALIGGPEQAGHGWKMLMSALAAGRGISLPSLSAASTAYCAHVTGAYARVRRQFGIPIGKFEGVQEKLGELAATAYQVDAARRLTCVAIDQGHKPAVISAIMKYHATEKMRMAVNHAMDIHAGKAVIEGPRNYLAALYRAVPVGITVEGANILTRCLIVFGQGAIRAHPYLMQEMLALGDEDQARGLDTFDEVIWQHIKHAFSNTLRAWGRTWTGGLFAPAPSQAGRTAPHYRQLSRYAAAFALVADATLGSLGGALKRKEMLSGRLGDILAELYLMSATLKRWHDEGRRQEDLPLLEWCMASGYATIEARLDAVLGNLPSRPLAAALRLVVLPLGPRQRGPSDDLTRTCAELLLQPSPTRDRLTAGLAPMTGSAPVAVLERAFAHVVATQPLADQLRHAGEPHWQTALARGIITQAQADQLAETERLVAAVIEVDDFSAEMLCEKNARADESGRAQ